MNTQFLNRFFYEGAEGDGGTPPKQPTLSDLTNPDYKPTDDVAEAARLAAEKEAADKAAADQAEAAYQALVAEAKNEDGTLKDGYIEVEGKIQKDPDYKPADGNDDEGNDDGDDSVAFFTDVNKLHGQEIVVEYPEGVDPLSPEGVYHRDKVIAQNAIDGFEVFLKKTDPRSYAYMLHRQAGGDDDSFFSQKSFSLPEYDTFKDSPDLQVKILKSSLMQKGLDEETAQFAVDKATKDGVLFTKADAEYKATQQAHEAELKAIEDRNKAAEQEYVNGVNSFNQKLTTTIQENKGMQFIIPDTDKAAFAQFVKEHVEYDSNQKKFLIVQKVEDANLSKQLESMYLLYKKGDLTGLIKREAQTANVKRLKAVVDKSKQKGPAGGDDAKPKAFVPLGQL